MQFTEMKKSFWGYKKDDVLLYIAVREEEFSQQLQKKNQEAEDKLLQAKERIRRLEQDSAEAWAKVHDFEQQIQALQQELEPLRKQQALVSDALVDARLYAQQLREESQSEAVQAQDTLRQTLERDLDTLSGYRAKIESLRHTLQAMLEDFDQRAGLVERQAGSVAQASPAGNLTLLHFGAETADAI